MLSRRERFLVFLPDLPWCKALDGTTKPVAPSSIAYNNHYGAHLPASPAHDILMKTSLLRHLHPQPAARRDKDSSCSREREIDTHKKASHVIDIHGRARRRRLGIGILGSRIRRR